MRKVRQRRGEPFLKHLGEAVRNQRIELLLSQAQLGERCNLHRTYITDIEGGLRNTSILTLQRVAAALTIRLSALIDAAEKLMNAN
ncbi:MAG: helix-turn-helix domain-containing protein [Candidatus Obscuribacterales bacterium]|nr:helix-turn-helix domain-containing protein [Candidatus Obscuribacterales bacterium]